MVEIERLKLMTRANPIWHTSINSRKASATYRLHRKLFAQFSRTTRTLKTGIMA